MSTITLIALVVAVVAAVRSLWSPCGLSMISSITPFGERARGHRYSLTAGWFLSGALVGGAVLAAPVAALAALVGWLDPAPAVVGALAVLLSVIGIASDQAWFGRSLPVHPRQVDETWLAKYRRWLYAAGFGAQIGSGFATYIMTSAVYLTAALAVLTGSPAQAVLICLVFAATRGLLVLTAAWARTPDRLRRLHSRIAALAPASMTAAVAVQLWSAVAALGLTFGHPWIGVAAGSALVAGWLVRLRTQNGPAPTNRDRAVQQVPAVTG